MLMMSITEFSDLKASGEEIFRKIATNVNNLSDYYIRKDKSLYRRKEDLDEIFM